MTKEQYFDDTLLRVKYNKTLKTLPLRLNHLYESIYVAVVRGLS